MAAAWNVRACTPSAPSCRSRVRISPAARAVKVTASSAPAGHGAGADGVGGAVGDGAGLAGAGAGQDADRAVHGLGGGPLLGVERFEQVSGVTRASSQRRMRQGRTAGDRRFEHTVMTIYSTQWCGYCHRLMKQLDREGVGYDVIDIEARTRARRTT